MIKIASIEVYQIDLPIKEGRYSWSNKNSVSVFDSTVVKIKTNHDIVGLGEVCTLGPSYLPAYPEGVRAGIKKFGKALLGLDPTELTKINAVMDANLKGHNYVKSPIDMACWDILGKYIKQPIWKILGGKFGKEVDLYRAISQERPNIMSKKVKKYKKEGYRKFQLKVGGDPAEDIERIKHVRSILDNSDVLVADANTGWLMHDALNVIKATEHLDVYYEQPCVTYEESLSVRQKTKNPFILDENIDSISSFLRAYNDRAMDLINIKISKMGGLTKSRLLRDLCIELGVAMTIEDSWGGDIATAAISHLAHSTPEKLRFSSTDFNSYNTLSYSKGSPQRKNGSFIASNNYGLGLTINEKKIGKSIFTIK